MEEIGNEQRTLLALLGHNLFGAPFEAAPDTDWEALAKEAKAQAVFSIAFHRYQELPIDDELGKKIQSTLLRYMLVSSACFRNHTYLHNLMTQHKISYCAIKGAASAAYYPDPILRSMGDVDFYVHPADIQRALAIFEAEGFTADDKNHPSHISMIGQRKHIEMHFKPVGYREGPVGLQLEEYWKDILEKSVLNETELATYRGPSVFHHGFILLTHLQHHLFQEGIGLRHFCDWALFANSFSDAEFTALFEVRLKQIGLYKLAQILSLGAVKHMGMEHRPWMGDEYDTADELLQDILQGGNFGRKDRKRSYESMFISDRSAGNFGNSRLKQLFKSLNKVVDYHWSAAKKCSILYPIGWVFFSVRYLVRVLLGKRQLNLVDNYKKSGQRNKKYAKVKVFEPENDS